MEKTVFLKKKTKHAEHNILVLSGRINDVVTGGLEKKIRPPQ